MRAIAGILLLTLTGIGCAAKAARPAPPPPPSAADEAGRVARLFRLIELNRQRVALEVERVGLSQRYGENHPEMVRLRGQIEVVDTAIKREFAPEEEAAVARYQDQALRLQLRLKELQSRGLGENHPEMVAIRAQLQAIYDMTRKLPAPTDEARLLRNVQESPEAAEPLIELALHYAREHRAADAESALNRAIRLLRARR